MLTLLSFSTCLCISESNQFLETRIMEQEEMAIIVTHKHVCDMKPERQNDAARKELWRRPLLGNHTEIGVPHLSAYFHCAFLCVHHHNISNLEISVYNWHFAQTYL
jgi:hypothetical protein